MGYFCYFVYLLTNKNKTVLYAGVTNSLEKRVWQHKRHAIRGFTGRYNCDRLVYFESFDEINEAIAREKQIKGWSRAKKSAIVSSENREWRDLAEEWFD